MEFGISCFTSLVSNNECIDKVPNQFDKILPESENWNHVLKVMEFSDADGGLWLDVDLDARRTA
jgi:hypothetical protein